MALREFLPPEPGLSTRRQARARRRRRTGPLVAGLIVVAAATTGSVAALMSSGTGARDEAGIAAYPSSTATSAGSRAGVSAPVGAGPVGLGTDVGLEPEVSADGPAALVMPVGRTYRGAPWPALTYTLKAVSGGMAPAPFPTVVPGYRLADSFTTRLNVVLGKHFAVFGDLPVKTVSYAECRRQRFFVRWQSVDPAARVEATFVDALVRTVQNHPVTGSAGWLSSYGCVQPAMRIPPPAGSKPSHAMVVAQMQVWQRR